MSKIDFYSMRPPLDGPFYRQVLQRMEEIVRSASFIEGEWNARFEERFARLQNAPHCGLTANGTDALEIALQTRGIGPDDQVGVPGITFYASAEAILNVGATPVLIDVAPETGLICPDSLARIIERFDLAALMPVHIYGLPAPMPEIAALCAPKKIAIIEDAAQAQGAFFPDGKPVGSPTPEGDNLVTFSFYPTKNLGAFGDAGCILAHAEDDLATIKSLRNHGRGDSSRFGRNSRCDHLQAAVLELKLDDIEKLNSRRKQIAASYHQKLADLPLKLIPEVFLPLSSWHLYPLHLESAQLAERLIEFLSAEGVACQNFYSRALSQEPRWPSPPQGEWQNAEAMAGTVVCLPIHPDLGEQDIKRVARLIENFVSSVAR